MTKLTLERFENGIQLYQDENLYKFTSDSILLAKFCNIKHTDAVLDMCAGCGVVGFYAYSINKFNKLYLNDIQPEMCRLIKKNIELNDLNDKCDVMCKDLSLLKVEDFGKPLDVIVCNPPYFKCGGKTNEREDVAMCRHEITTNLNKIVSKASELIKVRGRLYFVIPATRMCESVIELNKNNFEVKNMQMRYHGSTVTACFIEAVKCANSGIKIKLIEEGV